jgi:hypothetical protein
MKAVVLIKLVAIASLAGLLVSGAQAFTTIGSGHPGFGANTGPAVVINWEGAVATITRTGAALTYDGSDDTYFAIKATSGNTLTSLVLSGGNIFEFESDGHAAYTRHSYDSSGYAGPDTSFTNISASHDSGTVNFLNGGPGAGEQTWCSLEEDVSAADAFAVGSVASVPDGGPTLAPFGCILIGHGLPGTPPGHTPVSIKSQQPLTPTKGPAAI